MTSNGDANVGAAAAAGSAPPSRIAEQDVDVAILGAGLTGLATAYALYAAEPGLRIAVSLSRGPQALPRALRPPTSLTAVAETPT